METILHFNKKGQDGPDQSNRINSLLEDNEYEAISQMAAHICQMPIALVSFVDEFSHWFQSVKDKSTIESQQELDFYHQTVINSDKPIIVEDAANDPRFSDNPIAIKNSKIRFFAGVKITDKNNHPFGTLCVMDHEPRQLAPEQIEYLSILSKSIKNRIKEQQQLQKQQAELDSFRHAVNLASLVSQTDKTGKIIFVNEKFSEISGYNESELLGQNHSILKSGQHEDSFFKDLWTQVLAGKAWKGEIKNKAKDGSFYWVETVITPVFNTDYKIDGFYSVSNLITDRKNTELKIKETEDSFISLAKSFSNIVWTMDSNGEPIGNTETWTNFTGQTLEQIKKGGWGAAIHPDDIERVSKIVENALKTGTPYQTEMRIRRMDGEWLWMASHAAPNFNLDGTIRDWTGCANEINQRKLTEEIIKAKNDSFLEAQRMANLGHWEFDIENNKVSWSDEIFKIFEVDPVTFEGKYDSFINCVHPEDREKVNNAYNNSIKNKTPYRIEFRILLNGNRIKYIETHCKTYYNSNGSPVKSFGNIVDITDQRSAENKLLEKEKRFYEVLENLNDGLLIDDVEGKVVYGNARLKEMFELSDECIKNLAIEDYVAPSQRAELRERHNKRIAGEDVEEIFEYEGILKTGKRKWFEARVSKIVKNGKIIGTQSAIRDITKKKKDDALYSRINQVIAVKTGKSYFSELTAFLCSQLNVKYAMVGHFIPESESIETISFRCGQEELPNITYSLKDTPCDIVINSESCIYQKNVQSNFPKDEDLKVLNIESYIGVQLRDEFNQVLGLIVLLHDKPMNDANDKLKIISFAAPRTANEIKHREFIIQLKESEEKYRNLFLKMNEGLVQTSTCGRIQLVNPQFEAITGFSKDELIGKNIIDFFQDKEKHLQQLEEVNQELFQVSKQSEEEFITKSGKIIWASISDSPIFNHNGEFIGLMSIISDITARKKSEEKIKLSRKLLKNLTDQVPGAVYQFQMFPDGRMVFPYFSKGVALLFPGLTSESIQKNAALIFQSVHPEDLPMVMESLKWSSQTHTKYNLQYRNVMPDGEIRWYSINSVPQKQPDGSFLWHGFFTDITEEKNLQQQSEETNKSLKQHYQQIQDLQSKYESILNNTSDLIHSIDAQGNLNYVNEAWLKTLGYGSADEVLGKSVLNFIHSGSVPKCQQLIHRIMMGEDVRFAETSFVSASGSKIDCEATIHANFVDGQFVNAEGFFRDVTDLKKERQEKEQAMQRALTHLEEKVQERTIELREANKEMEAFSYSVSHDLQAPLRLISGFSVMLNRKYSTALDAQGKEFLSIIDSNAKQMSQLIQDLLHFSRLGKAELSLNEVDMATLVDRYLEELRIAQPDIKTEFVIHPLPSAFCDKSLMKQVWANLIGNAVKYSSKKEKPQVEVGVLEQDGSTVYYVKDNGDGFDMAHAKRIFGVFQRLHRVDEFEGTGVGLATVQRIISKHSGKIWTEAEQGKGAVFYFTLPEMKDESK